MKAEKKLVFRCCRRDCYESNGDKGEPCEIVMPDLGILVGGNGIWYPSQCPWDGGKKVFLLVEGEHLYFGKATQENPIGVFQRVEGDLYEWIDKNKDLLDTL